MSPTQRVESVTHLKTCDAKLCEMLIRQARTMNNSSWNAARTGLYSSSVLRSICSLYVVAETRWLSAWEKDPKRLPLTHCCILESLCAENLAAGESPRLPPRRTPRCQPVALSGPNGYNPRTEKGLSPQASRKPAPLYNLAMRMRQEQWREWLPGTLGDSTDIRRTY